MVESNNAINNTIGASITGVTNTLTITNPSNTASSSARAKITVGGASAVDPSLNFNVNGVTDWEMGVDNNDTDKFKASFGTSLGVNDFFITHTSGPTNLPLQSYIEGATAPGQNAVTGDGTDYLISHIFITDIHGDSGGGVFTCPDTGIYAFYLVQEIAISDSSHTHAELGLAVNGSSNGVKYLGWNGFAMRAAVGPNACVYSAQAQLSLTAGDTLQGRILVSGGPKTINLSTNSNLMITLLH